MKNPKILPFGDWFRVYESAGRNYEKSQRILESKMYKGLDRIFEQNKAYGNTWLRDWVGPIKPGNTVPDLYDATAGIGISDKENNAAFEAMALKVFGKTAIPWLRANFGDVSQIMNSQGDQSNSAIGKKLSDFLKFYLAGIENRLGDTSLTDALLDEGGFDILNKLDIKSTADGEFDLYGTTGGTVSSYSRIDSEGTIEAKEVAQSLLFSRLLGYLNTFNLTNYATGDYTQYVDPKKLLDSNNIVSVANKAATEKNEFELYLFTDRKSEVTAAGKGFDIEIVAAETGKDIPFQINYKAGEFAVDADGKSIDVSHPDIIAIANSIVGSLKDQKIDNMTLTSSASPEWGSITTSGSGGSENPSPKLNDTTYKSDKTDAGNKYLAWRRGTYLVALLKGMLGNALGEVTNAWIIGEAGGAGRNCKYTITQLGKPGTTKITPNFTGAKTSQTGQGLLKVYRHKITFSEAELTKAKDTLLKKFAGGLGLGKSLTQYADIEKDQDILYYGAVKNADGDVVIHVSSKYSGADKIPTDNGERVVQKGGKLAGKSWKENLVKGKAKKSAKDNGGRLVVDFTKSDGTTVERTIPRDRFYSAGQSIEQRTEE